MRCKKVLENLDAGSAKTKYRIIEKAAEPYTVTRLCKFLGVSRSGYSAFLKRKDNDPDESIMTLTTKCIRNMMANTATGKFK